MDAVGRNDRRRGWFGVLLGIAAVGLLLGPRTSAAEPNEVTRARLSPAAELAGACWSSDPEAGPVDTHCWEWTLQGAFVRDRHEVQGPEGPYQGETLYGWDADKGRARYWYFNVLGGVSEGTIEKTDDGWLFEETYRDAQSTLQLRSRFRILDDRSYSVATERLDGSEWKPWREVRFVRIDAAESSHSEE